MTKNDYFNYLVENIHSATVATIGADGHPQTRVIDMMLWDEQGVYFLTARGKAFYEQLMEQGYVALSATRDNVSISLRGKFKISAAKSWMKYLRRTPICRKSIPAIPVRHWKYFACTKPRENTLISAFPLM